MACNTLTGIQKGCDNNIGGITALYIAPYDSVTGYTINPTTDIVTTIGFSGGSGNTQFVEFEFNKNTGNYTEEGTISLENGSTYFLQTINLTIPRREAAKRNSIALLAAGQQDLLIVIRDGNGLNWLFGKDNGVNLTATGEGSGTVKADGSKYTLTFVGEEPFQAYEVASSAIAVK